MAHYVAIDSSGLCPAFYSDDVYSVIPQGAVPIADAVWGDFLAHQGQRKWNASTLVFDSYTPPAAPTSAPTVTGNQWAFALSDMGLSSAWRIGVTKSKDSDQVRVGLIARDTPLVASDPLLIRVAVNAGLDAGGNPIVSVPAVFVHAQGMPT